MVTNLKFNVYYATTPSGPWTLANSSPIDYDASGEHACTVTGLLQNTVYYVAVVGGEVHNGIFYSLLTQHIGPAAQGAGSLEGVKLVDVRTFRTFAPHITTTDVLGHQFTVV